MKIIWTELLFLGVLSFCFTQTTSEFSKELSAAGISKSERRTPEYLANLRALEVKYASHLDSSCNDLTDLYRNIGMHYYHSNDKNTALVYVQDTALPMALSCDNIDHQLLTQIYLNILTSKMILDQKQELPGIVEILKKALENNKAGPLIHRTKIKSEISRYYQDVGDFDESLIWIRSSMADHNKLPPSERKLKAYLEWAYICYELEEYENAISFFDTTRVLARKLDLHNLPYYNEGIVYNKAVCYEDIGNYDEALKYTKLYASMTDPNDLIVQSDIHNLKAYVASKNGKFEKAVHHIDQSIRLSIESEDEYQLSNLYEDYIFWADALYELEQFKESANIAQKAISTSLVKQTGFDFASGSFNDLFVKNPNVFNQSSYRYFKAMTHFEAEEKIINFADQLDSTFFSLQTNFSGDESKSVVTERHHAFCGHFLQYIFENKLENKYPDLTCYYIGISKSLALLEKLSIKEAIPENLESEFNQINELWNEISSQLEVQETLENVAKIDSLAKRNFELSLRRDKLDKKLASLDLIPDFRNHRSSIIKHIQPRLAANEAIVDFFYGEQNIYSYFIDGKGVQFHTKEIHPLLKNDFTNTFKSTDAVSLANYDSYLSQFSSYFKTFMSDYKEDIKSLTIIPDGRLLYFPFEILETDGRPLLNQTSIHYLFSFSINQFNRENSSESLSSYAGFAMQYDETLRRDIFRSKAIKKIYKDSFMLSQLPYAVEEVRTAKKTFSGDVYVDASCTKAAFYENAEDYQILHLANHALLNEGNSNLSAFIFAKDGQPELLNVIDIKKLDLNADLAIFSSCNSGRGENINGSGLRSLGLSFAEAGCPAILVNLWEVSDKSTKFIIEQFSKNLVDGMSKSEALQLAKLDYIKSVPRELQHPKYWANMVLIGDNSTLDLDSGFGGWKAFLPLLVALLFVGRVVGKKLLSDRRQRKKNS